LPGRRPSDDSTRIAPGFVSIELATPAAYSAVRSCVQGDDVCGGTGPLRKGPSSCFRLCVALATFRLRLAIIDMPKSSGGFHIRDLSR
jgi:hypothetical protein